MDEFRHADLGRSMGLHQTGMGDEGEALPRFGVLNFVEKYGGDQHRIHLMSLCLAQDHRFQLTQPIQGRCAQGLELINSAGEQLGQLRLGSVHPEAPLEQLEFFGGEVCGLEPVSDDHRRLILKINHRLPPLTDQAETGCRHQQRRCPSQWLSHGGWKCGQRKVT